MPIDFDPRRGSIGRGQKSMNPKKDTSKVAIENMEIVRAQWRKQWEAARDRTKAITREREERLRRSPNEPR